MNKISRVSGQIWAIGTDGKASTVLTVDGHLLDAHPCGCAQGAVTETQLHGLRLAIHWTRVSAALWLQDLRQIFGRKA